MRRLAVLALLALLLGCQQSPAPGPQRGPRGSLTVQFKQEGDALAARGEYEAAAVKYQAAVNQEPEDVPLRYALGTVLSHLGRRQETIEQFRFVVSRGRPDLREVEVARNWLVSAGELAEPVTFAPAKSPEQEASPVVVQSVKVKVRTQPSPEARRVNITLANPSRALAFQRVGKLGDAFEFDNVPPGTYRLSAADAENGAEISNAEVTVAPGKDVELDLK